MSDGAISQDEIDALLSGVAVDGLNSTGHVTNGPAAHIDVPALQKMADELAPKLEENINKYTGASFSAGKPVVEVTERDKLLSRLPEVLVGVVADYNEGVKGSHLYLIPSELALKIFALVNSEEATEVDDMVLSVVSEIVSTHISSQILVVDGTGKIPGLKYATPEAVNEPKAMIMFPQGEFALTSYPLTLDGNAYTIWECMGGNVAERIGKALSGDSAASAGGASAPDSAKTSTVQPQMSAMQQPVMNGMAGGQQMQMGGMMPNMGMANMAGMNMAMPQQMGVNMGVNVPNVQQLQFPNLQNNVPSAEQGNIGLIMDVYMEMTVELGRTKKTIKDILGMGEGTIIELDKLAGEPVDILVNHKPIAKGEVVVIDENFGVRVTEILSPLERVNDLN